MNYSGLVVFISGSRAINLEAFGFMSKLREVIVALKDYGCKVVVGDAPGVDAAVIKMCDEVGVPVVVYGAYGKLRNKTMTGQNITISGGYTERDVELTNMADRLVCFWDGKSRGTKANIDRAGNKPVRVYKF